MYKIFSNETLVAAVTTPTWVKMQDNGSFTLCGADDAQGVVMNGTVYYVIGKPKIEGHPPVVVAEVDDVAYQIEQQTIQASVQYVAQQNLYGKVIETDDQKIRASGLYPAWAEGKHTKGDVYNANGQTWECYQDYDNATHPDITPDNSAWYTFNRPLHGKTKETARPFVPVQGAHDMYHTGEYMIFTDGKVYRCKQDTNFSPTDYAQVWEVVE